VKFESSTKNNLNLAGEPGKALIAKESIKEEIGHHRKTVIERGPNVAGGGQYSRFRKKKRKGSSLGTKGKTEPSLEGNIDGERTGMPGKYRDRTRGGGKCCKKYSG